MRIGTILHSRFRKETSHQYSSDALLVPVTFGEKLCKLSQIFQSLSRFYQMLRDDSAISLVDSFLSLCFFHSFCIFSAMITFFQFVRTTSFVRLPRVNEQVLLLTDSQHTSSSPKYQKNMHGRVKSLLGGSFSANHNIAGSVFFRSDWSR